MFKKAVYIIISALLIISTTGLAVSRHYCGPELVSVSVFDVPESCCDMEGCCHNDYDYLQVNDDFICSSAQNIQIFSCSVDLQLFSNSISPDNMAGKTFTCFSNHKHPPPPLLKKVLPRLQSFLL